MRGARSGAGRRGRAEGARALEELVRTVVVLDGPRAPVLLSGLSDAVYPAALALFRDLERCSRAERHARLAIAFAARPAFLAAAEGIPGRLGTEVRAALTRDASPERARDDTLIVRWARRLVLELGDR